MKTTKLFFMAALALMTAACSNDDNDFTQQPQQAKGITITAQLAPKTNGASTRAVEDKTTYIEAKWAVNEHIAILYNKDGNQMADATITAVDGTTGVATITFTVVEGTSDGTSCTLVYPLSAAQEDKSGVKDAATLLAAQDGTLNANLDVRVGAGTIQTATPGLTVTTQPAAQFAIFKFTVKNADASASISVKPLTISTGGKDYVITPTTATSTLYAALPAISEQSVTFTATSSDSKNYLASKAIVSFAAGKFYQSTLKMTQLYPFTVKDDGTKVQVLFAPGNLQATYNGTAWNWHFAANQWDYKGDAVGNTKVTDSSPFIEGNGTVDLFGWVGNSSTWDGVNQYGITSSPSTSTNNTDGYGNVTNESLKSDWGTNIGTGWRTLTKDEWTYLFETRSSASTVNGTSNARYTDATINTDGTSVNGMILFPDGITVASSEATSWGAINSDDSEWGTKCTTAQWAALAAKGCVFLPAAGDRSGKEMAAVNSDGRYWTSSPYTDVTLAYHVFFTANNLSLTSGFNRSTGCSVRLVRDL